MSMNYGKYVAFINGVVDNTIEYGLEYENFYLALFFAKIFLDYKTVYESEDGVVDIYKEWDELSKLNLKVDKNGETKEISLTDFVILDELFDFCTLDDNIIIHCYNKMEAPISIRQYDEMVSVIDKKLDNYYAQQANITPLNTSLSELVDVVTGYITNMENSFANVDMNSVIPVITELNKNIKNIDKKKLAKSLAVNAHKDNKAGESIEQ